MVNILNKIQWLDWGKDSFDKSRASGKPILLDIKGSWCHWCHVMDDTTYSDLAVIDTINKHFVPVRVDTDKRPDVNRRYNMGGWPTTAFLDSEGGIITGGTYIPPQQFRDVLRSVLDYYAKNKGKSRSKLEPITIPKATGQAIEERIVRDIATSIAVNFDIDYGGFGSEPKFPHTDSLDLALLRYKYGGEKEMLTVVNKTLDKMGRGGMYDQVEGGFFRYSTTRDWSIPHFEKMAEDNARLLAVYLHAVQITGNEYYRQVAEGIIRYVQITLSDEGKGGFYGSQDADEEYYKLVGKAREESKSPSVDGTFYSNYNALFVSSFLLAGVVLDRPDLASFALKTLDRIMENFSQTAGVAHYWGVEASNLTGLLVDHACLLNTLLDAYEYTGKWSFVDRALELADLSLKTLHDLQNGGFYDIPESEGRLGELKTRDKPLDENSVMALGLLRLSWITGSERFSGIALKTLQLFVESHERHGLMAAGYAIALDSYLNGPIGLTIVGPQIGGDFESLKTQSLKAYPARRSILYLDTAKDAERIEKLGYKSSNGPQVYTCVGKVCGPPLKEPSQIESSLSSLLQTAAKGTPLLSPSQEP
jgi:uncharacterized protein